MQNILLFKRIKWIILIAYSMLLAWEKELVRECCEILSNIVLQPNIHDKRI